MKEFVVSAVVQFVSLELQTSVLSYKLTRKMLELPKS